MRYLLLACCLALQGCLPYPVYKQLQPESRVRVVDAAGAPLAGASVTLLANTYPYGREHHRETQVTDAAGEVLFSSRREWRAETLFIHGAQVFVWRLCIAKPGYATYLNLPEPGSDFNADATIALQPGATTPCPSRAENS
ncbi:carboxypeptidase-like regulatory domain-containing protein [Orrella dioscoreae]|uniref:carboxypeptidase-like regulatory domain-containing protein n=1 Tax=Orrella dioscoreae TaxID=1851544 RepID=UPI0008317A19|nr:carboxypeptidase-like regulatory domain-containing protein [Orrella dioscoreae]